MATDRETQREMILAALRAGRSLSPRDAQVEFGCWRLAAVIHVLRQAGYDVRTDMINKHAVYYLPVAPRSAQLQLADFGRPNVGY